MFFKTKKLIRNNKGQGLIEYLILVAILAVGTIGVVKIVGQNIRIQYANINRGLGAEQTSQLKAKEIQASQVNQKDLTNFLEGSR